ncbi:unnamed protein product [Allacma fusca]|uniref:Uncharacterized protein n=1 Tax=Allacma fusca TaxID=39272 RepID=A0A8J2Q265_9HEXA|nr:unnamed protein product [Allacma fusca]
MSVDKNPGAETNEDIEDKKGFHHNSSAGTSTLFELIPNIETKVLWVCDPCTCCECCHGCHLRTWCVCLAFTEMFVWIPPMCIYLTIGKLIRKSSIKAAELMDAKGTQVFISLVSTTGVLSQIFGLVFIIGIFFRLKILCIVHATASAINAMFITAAFLDAVLTFPFDWMYMIWAPTLICLLVLYLFLVLASYGLFTRMRADADDVHSHSFPDLDSCVSHFKPEDINKKTLVYSPNLSSIYDGKYSYLESRLISNDSDDSLMS